MKRQNAQAGGAAISALLVVAAFLLFPTLEVLLVLAVLLALVCLLATALLVSKHGLAGCLYLGAAHLMAIGDAVAVAQERHRLSLADYRREALVATRVMQEAL